ncbi:hypothetical protein DYBT9275_00354 [Dyadobacter sp. CECT 9275]|uniref:Lipoprotein n=1 Tax=Dyadobacter helix TaxID=2822344 RepID=A0A916J7U5_9BACT|nr:hypothetical protein [Dyadobacter sp. CECT 9275]CAG4989714.1 hypothetical protein DYBT9275_00354 [Dyadobacter sp. CECT 9275]
MKTLPFILLILLFAGCKEENYVYKTFSLAGFQLEARSNWHEFQLQGIDSKVGGITNGKDKLTYDLGWYSYAFQNETQETHIKINTTVNGKDALIVRPIRAGKGIIGIYIRVDSLTGLSMYGTSKNEDEILKIFNSIKIL